MENIGTIISILVGLVTLLSMLVWFGRFIQRVNVHDKKLDEVSSDMYDIKKLVTIHDSKMDAISKNVGALRLDVDDLKQDMTSIKTLLMAKFKEF